MGVQGIFEQPVIEKPLAVIKFQNHWTQTDLYYQISADWTLVIKQGKKQCL